MFLTKTTDASGYEVEDREIGHRLKWRGGHKWKIMGFLPFKNNMRGLLVNESKAYFKKIRSIKKRSGATEEFWMCKETSEKFAPRRKLSHLPSLSMVRGAVQICNNFFVYYEEKLSLYYKGDVNLFLKNTFRIGPTKKEYRQWINKSEKNYMNIPLNQQKKILLMSASHFIT